ncbi:MAG: response regulator transcription factor, partial [Gammaproteobacteria bacterium]
RDGRQGGPGCTLTARERDVLRLLAQGRRNREISESLHISERTVKFHMTALFQKLEAGNRTQAVRKAINYGLVHP